MNHAEANSHLPDYLEGDLDLTRRALLDAHLDGCSACSREFAEMRRAIDLLRSLPDPESPPFFAESVMRRIRQGEGRRGFAERLRDWLGEVTSPQVAIPAAALAIGLLMVFGAPGSRTVWRFAVPHQQSPRPERLVQSTADDPALQTLLNQVEGSFQQAWNVSPASLSVGGSPPVPGPAPRIKLVIHPAPVAIQRDGVTPVYVNDRLPGRGTRTLMRWPRSVVNPGMPYFPNSAAYPVEASNSLQNVGVQTTAPGFVTQPQSEVERAQRLASDLDRRLDEMAKRPVAFASGFESLAPVEQDLWLEALSNRAVTYGRGDRVLEALRRSGDRRALEVATAFAAQLRRAGAGADASAAPAVEASSSVEPR